MTSWSQSSRLAARIAKSSTNIVQTSSFKKGLMTISATSCMRARGIPEAIAALLGPGLTMGMTDYQPGRLLKFLASFDGEGKGVHPSQKPSANMSIIRMQQ
jgi:hypothetical protein